MGDLVGGSTSVAKALDRVDAQIVKVYKHRIKDDQKAAAAARKAIADLKKQEQAVAGMAAQYDKLAAKIKRAHDYARELTSGILDASGVTTVQSVNEAPITAGFIVQGLDDQLAKIDAFRANLRKLRKAGLSKASLREIESSGYEEGGVYAAALAGATAEQIKAINKSQAAISKSATGVGRDAVSGLLEGLGGQMDKVEKAGKRIAERLRNAIRRELGLKGGKGKGGKGSRLADVGGQGARDLADGVKARGMADRVRTARTPTVADLARAGDRDARLAARPGRCRGRSPSGTSSPPLIVPCRP